MERLIGSDAALGQLLDNIAVLVARVDLGGTFLYASAAAWAIFGRDPHQLLGTQVLDLVHPSDRAKAESRMREAGSGTGNETQMLLRIVRPGGETVWIQAGGRLLADPESGERSIAFVAFEATARVEAEAARDRTEARFRDLIEWLPAVVYEAEPGPDGRFLYVSPQISELLGYDDREWLARPELWRESIHPEERERVLDLEREQELQSLETDTRIASEYRMQHRSGRTVWVRDVARISRGSGDGRFWRGVMIDISAERTAQLALADAHERHRGMVDSLPACSYRAERRAMGSWQFVSSQIERLLGYTPREWCADPTLWRASLHADDRDRIELEEQRHMEMPPGTEAVLEYRLRHRSGRVVAVRDRAILTLGDEGEPMIEGILTDVGAERAAEAVAGLADVYRLTCGDCAATWAAERVGPCPSCRNHNVESVSLNTTLAALADARQQVEGLLDGIQKHLDALGSNIRAGSAALGSVRPTDPH